MRERFHIVSINQDPGISPHREKGAAVHLRAMRDAFARLGARVTVVDEAEGSRVSLLLNGIHRSDPIDLIYERYALGKSAGAEFAGQHGISFALEVNAPLADEQARWRSPGNREQDLEADRLTFGRASFIRSVSTAVAEYARSRGGHEEAIHVLPNGIDTSLFNLGARDGRGQRPGMQANTFVIGFHGRERPWHCFDRLVDLVRNLLDRSLAVRLEVIGNGEFQALDRLPEGTFSRMPWVEHRQLPPHLGGFDAMPFTYSPDLPCYFSPLKLMEGMACGVVPVVPDLGDLPRIVQHGRNGLVYAAGRDDLLFEALASLISDQALSERLRVNAARTAEAHDWRRIAGSVLDRALYQSGNAAMQRVVRL